jgi:NHL repeat
VNTLLPRRHLIEADLSPLSGTAAAAPLATEHNSDNTVPIAPPCMPPLAAILDRNKHSSDIKQVHAREWDPKECPLVRSFAVNKLFDFMVLCKIADFLPPVFPFRTHTTVGTVADDMVHHTTHLSEPRYRTGISRKYSCVTVNPCRNSVLYIDEITQQYTRSTQCRIVEIAQCHQDGSTLQPFDPQPLYTVLPVIACSPDGHVVSCTRGEDGLGVQIFEADGKCTQMWSVESNGKISVRNLAVTNDVIFIAFFTGSCVHAIKWNGEPIGIIRPTKDGKHVAFHFRHIAADHQDLLYLSDSSNHMIRVVDMTGEIILSIGGFGSIDGRMRNPDSICVTPDGFIVVHDTGNKRFQVFAPASWTSAQQYGYTPAQFITKFSESVAIGTDVSDILSFAYNRNNASFIFAGVCVIDNVQCTSIVSMGKK